MSNNPTKILLNDLEDELIKLLTELKNFQGAYNSLYDRLTNLGTDDFSKEVQEVIDDLINGYQNGGVLTIQRIENLKQDLEDLKADLEAQIDILSDGTGNYQETFTYDNDGNVIEHVYTGDRNYKIIYNYKTDGSGELVDSIKEFTDKDGNTVKVTQTYTYTDGNITNIKTTTTVTPNVEEE